MRTEGRIEGDAMNPDKGFGENADEVYFDDQMPKLPDAIEVETLGDVINATGLSPEALEPYRISQSVD